MQYWQNLMKCQIHLRLEYYVSIAIVFGFPKTISVLLSQNAKKKMIDKSGDLEMKDTMILNIHLIQ